MFLGEREKRLGDGGETDVQKAMGDASVQIAERKLKRNRQAGAEEESRRR